ncbi:MAG: PAS domain S-box protein [Betaproteobacteria bacterium]
MLNRGEPRYTDDGGFEGFVGQCIDVSERKVMEEALHRTQERYRLAVEVSGGGVFDWDMTAKRIYITEIFGLALGLQASSGEPSHDSTAFFERFEERLHPDDRAARKAALIRLFREREPFRIEYRVARTDGEYRWFEMRADGAWDHRGVPVRMFGSIVDATDRRRAEQSLQESQRFLEAVLTNLPMPISVKSSDHRFVQVNDAFVQWYGQPRERIVGHTDREITTPEAASRAEAMDALALERREPVDYDLEYVVASGEWRACEARQVAVEGRDGELFLVTMVDDVTERRAAERALADSRHLLDAILDALPIPIFAKDAQHRYILSNAAYLELNGCLREDLIGKTDREKWPQKLAERHIAEDLETFSGGRFLCDEELHRRPDGEERWLYKTKKAVTLRNGERLVVGALVDITERRRAEQAALGDRTFLDAVLDAVPVVVMAKDRDQRWHLANRAAAQFHGTDAEQIIGHTDWEIFGPEQAARLKVQDEQLFATMGQESREELHETAAGGQRWVQTTRRAVRMPDGRDLILVSVLDIDGRRRAERESQRGKDFLDALLNALPVPVAVKDSNRRFILMNSEMGALLGRSREEVIGRTDSDVFPESQAATNAVQDEQLLREMTSFTREELFTTARGEQRWVLKRKRAVQVCDGEVVLITSMLDISERKSAEHNVLESKQFLDALVNAIPEGIYVKDASARWILANDVACRRIGQSRGDLLGRTNSEIFSPRDARVFDAEDALALASDGPVHFEGRPISQGESEAWLLKTKMAVPQPDGRRYLICASVDVTAWKRASLEVDRGRRFLEALVDRLPHPTYVKDRDHRWIIVNDAMCKLYGRERQGLIGRTDYDLLEPEYAAKAWAEDDRAFAVDGTRTSELEVRLPDGRLCWLLKTKAAMRGDDGMDFIVGTSLDISERKRAERTLIESERRLGLLNELSSAAARGMRVDDVVHLAVDRLLGHFPGVRVLYSSIDESGHALVEYAGPAPEAPLMPGFGENLQQRPDDLEALRAGQIIVLDDAAESSRNRTMASMGARIGAIVDIPIHHDGHLAGMLSLIAERVRVWSDHEVIVTREVADLLALVGANAEVERRRMIAERALQDSESFLKAALLAADVALWSWDIVTGEIYLSTQMKRSLGFEDDEMDSSWPAWEAAMHPDDVDGALNRLKRSIVSDAAVFEAEFRMRHRDRRWIWFLSRANIVREASGRAVRMLGGHIDISEQKRAQDVLRGHRDELERQVRERTAELVAAKNVAEAANLAKSEFLANMSHELRTPMHAILSFARLGLKRTDAHDGHQGKLAGYFGRIDQSADRLLALLNDLLDLSKMEAGGMAYEMSMHDLREVAADVIREYDALAQERGVGMILDETDGDMRARFDRGRIEQVIRNLVSNALKFTPRDKSVHLRIEAADIAVGRRRGDAVRVPALRLVVSDEGIGIPESELESVFDKFVQSSKTKSGAGGTGLGLAICREIVAAHGGLVWARSNATGGADFVLELPRDSVVRAVQEAATSAQTRRQVA